MWLCSNNTLFTKTGKGLHLAWRPQWLTCPVIQAKRTEMVFYESRMLWRWKTVIKERVVYSNSRSALRHRAKSFAYPWLVSYYPKALPEEGGGFSRSSPPELAWDPPVQTGAGWQQLNRKAAVSVGSWAEKSGPLDSRRCREVKTRPFRLLPRGGELLSAEAAAGGSALLLTDRGHPG